MHKSKTVNIAVFFGVITIIVLAITLLGLFNQKRKISFVSKHLLINQPPVSPKADAVFTCLGDGLYNIHNWVVHYQFNKTNCYPIGGDPDTASFEVLGYGFARDKNKVFYNGQVIEVKSVPGQTVKIDKNTFEALSDGYARDKHSVYFFQVHHNGFFNTHVIDGADPETFIVLTPWFGKDARAGYLGWSVIPQSNGSTFEVVDVIPIDKYKGFMGKGKRSENTFIGFTKDVSHVFINEDLIAGADPKTFQIYEELSGKTGRPFSRDAQHVYLGTNVIPKADPDSFQPVKTMNATGHCTTYFKDKTHVFAETGIMEGADPVTFRYVGLLINPRTSNDYFCIASDKNNVYVNNSIYFDTGQIPANLDPQSLRVLGIYLKDKNAVYFGVTELDDADPASFELLGEDLDSIFAKDKNSIYECGQIVMPNKNGFQPLGDYYGKTGTRVYYRGKVILGAAPLTFEMLGRGGIFPCESQIGAYAKDGNHVYFSGNAVPGADSKTFKLGFSLATDTKTSPENTRTTELWIGQDKNGEYRYGVKIPNDFIKCSADLSDLPGGPATWKLKLPSLSSDIFVSSFEFCLMPNQNKLIGYKQKSEIEIKKFDWFDEKNDFIGSMDLNCGDPGQVLPQSIRALDGSKVTFACLNLGACNSRVFFETDLNQWKTSSPATLRKTDESYDCGYRG